MIFRPSSIFFSGLALAMLTLTGCQETVSETPAPQTSDTIQVSSSGTFMLEGQVFSVPSPVQTAIFIQKEKGVFRQEVLHPLDRRTQYVSESQKAMNLGVYGADLAYISCYDKPQASIEYFDAVSKLAADLGVLDQIDKNLAQRFMENMNTPDSLLRLNGSFYLAADRYLKESKNPKVAALILLGGWVESLNLLCQSASDGPSFTSRIGSQRDAAQSIANLFNKLNDESMKSIVSGLNDLSDLFSKLTGSYEYVKPITDGEQHTTYLMSKTRVEVDDAQLKAISEKVSEIRNLITQ